MVESKQRSPKSPCIQECRLVEGSHCSGCLRTRTEIATWSKLSTQQQWDLLDTLTRRRATGRHTA